MLFGQHKLGLRWIAAAVGTGLAIGAVVNAFSQSPGVNSPFQPVWSIPIDSIKRTYSFANQLSPVGFATDIATICGSASVTTKVERILITARATAVSPMDIWIVMRSNWDTLATTQLSATGVPHDATDAASQAAVTLYTALPTNLGTTVGNIAVAASYYSNLTTGIGYPQWSFDWSDRADKAPTLRSATQCLAINLSGQSQGGNVDNIWIEWTEE
jgi:hypothetical protein